MNKFIKSSQHEHATVDGAHAVEETQRQIIHIDHYAQLRTLCTFTILFAQEN